MPTSANFNKETAAATTGNGANSFFAGCSAGVVGCIVGHPFDTVKLVQQTRKGVGLFQGLGKLISAGGHWALWRGMGPALAVQVITSGFLFGTQTTISDQVSKSFGQWKWLTRGISSEEGAIDSEYKLQQAMSVSSVPCATISGFLTGGLLAPIVCPLEGFKCRAQATVEGRGPRLTHSTNTSSSFIGCHSHGSQFSRNIYSFRRLYSGFVPSMLRCSFGNAAFFGIYSLVQSVDNISPAIGGALAGAAFWIVGFPFDVLKSRMQTADLRSATPTLQETFRSIRTEVGLRGFYVGLPITLLRAIPMNAAVLLSYEVVLSCCT